MYERGNTARPKSFSVMRQFSDIPVAIVFTIELDEIVSVDNVKTRGGNQELVSDSELVPPDQFHRNCTPRFFLTILSFPCLREVLRFY